MEKRTRIPMFFKFLVGCLTLAAMLILGGAWVVQSETKMKSRGNYLTKHYKRYAKYQEGLGRGVSSAADRIAQTPQLRVLLASTDTVEEAAPAAPTPSAAQIAATEFDLLSGKRGLQPSLMVVFGTGDANLIWASPHSIITREDLRDLEPVARLRNGTAFFNKVLIHRGKAVQIAGIPIRSPDGKTLVGGVILGVDLERYMLDYKEQSDSKKKEEMQHRLTLVHDGEVVASVMPKELWPELATALDEEHWAERAKGEETVKVIPLKQGDYDFYHADVEGFAGLQSGKVGTMFMLRSRANLRTRSEYIPWKEGIIGIILSLVIAWLLAFWITRPIKQFVRQSERMLEGTADLRQRIEIGSRDEVRDLADNINRVFARMYALAIDVQTASFQVGASSAEISAASKQMLGGLRDQTLKIEGSTAAVTELSASIQQVASNATEATKRAEKSNAAVTSAVDRMQKIRRSVEDAAAKIHELGESGKRIGNIVEVIRQISEQTSLLALNASIEAAHAGEQGRGFAVVADEVSSLAGRVGQSAKDIEDLIQTIKEQTAEAVQSMQVGTSEVESGTELVTTTLHDIKEIMDAVSDTAAAVQQQAVVSDEIARNMDAVQKIATEMLAGSEEAVVQGEQLHELAFGLEQSVGGFNLEPGGADRPRLPK